jgi:membrane-associated phospholipid phosphatase
MAKETKAKYIFAWLTLTSLIYFSIQAIVPDSYSFMTSLDTAIPFLPGFIWLYHTLVPVILWTSIYLIKRRFVFFNTVCALTFSMAVLTCFHLAFPSFYPRQELVYDGFSASLWLVEITRQFDAACNTFPSGHVTFSWIMFFCVRLSDAFRIGVKISNIYLLWAIFISISTLVLKQHYIFDVVSGIILGYISVVIGSYMTKRHFNVEENS